MSLRIDTPILIGLIFIAIILAAGTSYTMATQGTATFISPNYLLQQLHFGAFLGITAAGMMMVILLGHIDLSVPWTLTTSAMVASAIGGFGGDVTGILVGLTVGLVNGIGVAVLRVPSMIFTLGVNTVLLGCMVMLTGGHAPQSAATDLMLFLGRDRSFGVPHSVVVWALVSASLVFVLNRTPLGRYMYAIGNQEAAAYLSGVRTRLVIIASFMMCSLCAAIAGLSLAGYSARAFQAMGDQYLLPSIAAVVLGGTNILGGQGKFSGTVVGVVLIVLLQSLLSMMQMEEAYRQVIYGAVIIAMLLLYGRSAKAAA